MNVLAMNIFSIPLDKIELIQPGWLWLIPTYVLVYLFLKNALRKNILFEECENASLASTTTKNQNSFFHPLAYLVTQIHEGNRKSTPRKFLYFIIYSLLVIALSQPVLIGKRLPEPPRQRDIVFIVDASVSMILRDYILQGERIDRMSLLKAMLDNFIQKFKGERMSIIVFGDTAYTLVPLTTDQMLLRNMLARVQATMAGRFNAMGEAIALAVKQSQEIKSKNLTSAGRKRVLVLLTDSDQPTGKIEPLVAAKLAWQNKLPVYTIAIGATNPAAEETRGSGLLYAPVDLDLLSKISKITGAKSYHAINTQALSRAIQDISAHESNLGKIKPEYYRQDFYYWFLILAMSLFLSAQVFEILRHKIHQEITS